MEFLLLEEKARNLETKNDIPRLAEKHYNLSSAKIDNLLYASKMAAKIDNAAVPRWVHVISSCHPL